MKISSQDLYLKRKELNLKEIWKQIEDYEYEVSSFGRVKSIDKIIHSKNGKIQYRKGKIIKDFIDSSGYHYVDLYKNGKKKRMKVHRLVAFAFVENTNIEKYDIVNHIDGNKDNNKYNNLEWTDHSGNSIHATKTGLNQIDTIISHSLESRIKLYRYDLKGNLIAEYNSVSEACEDIGISRKSGSYMTKKIIDSEKVYHNSKWYSNKK